MIEYPRIILSEVMQEKSGLNKEGSGRNFLMKAYRCLKGVEEKQVVFHRKSTMAERLREVSANTPAKEPDYKYINVINRTSKTAFYDDVRRKIEYLTGIDIEPIHSDTFRKNGRYIIRLDTSELSNNERLRIESSVVKLKLRSEGYSTSRGGWYRARSSGTGPRRRRPSLSPEVGGWLRGCAPRDCGVPPAPRRPLGAWPRPRPPTGPISWWTVA